MPARNGEPLVVEETLDVVVARARALVRADRRTLLGITGAPGAGKSTLAAALTAALGPDAALVGMDGFHLADAELRRLNRRKRKGAPDTFDSWGTRPCWGGCARTPIRSSTPRSSTAASRSRSAVQHRSPGASRS